MIFYVSYVLLIQFFTAGASIIVRRGIVPITQCEVCSTELCNTEATFYKSNMDTTVNPCDDFHQFVCGEFLKKNANLSDGISEIGSTSFTQWSVDMVITEQLKEDDKPNDLATFKKIKIHWRNCMDKSRIEKDGTQPILELLQSMGGWPVVQGRQWHESEFDLTASLAGLSEKNVSVSFPFHLRVTHLQKNSTEHILLMEPPVLTYTPVFFMNPQFPEAYRDYIASASIQLGANELISQQEASEIREFEEELLTILMTVDPEYPKLMSIRDLSTNVPTIPWLLLFNAILKSSGIRVDENELAMVPNLKYFSEMADLIRATPKRLLANYLGWSVVQIAMPYLPANLYGLKENFDEILTGVNAALTREYMCLGAMKNSFEIGLSSMYVRKHFDRRIKRHVEELFSYIKDETRRNLQQVDWMDEQTKRTAIEKLEAMRRNIAYPEELLDDQKVDDYYRELDIAPGNYLTSALKIAGLKRTAMFKDFRVEVDKYSWKNMKSSTTVTPFYDRVLNLVAVTAAVLQTPFYHYDRPQYLNFGGIGTVLGHEITHAFDNVGRLYDQDGNMKNWWDSVTERKFVEKAQCLVEQYDNFVVKDVGLMVNGELTLNENIADNGGIKTAYHAYNEWASRNQITEMCLPYFENYTARQMFWISAASHTCNVVRPEVKRVRMSWDEHSPCVARGTIPFANIPEFARDFQCAPGSRMNPVDRCIVW